MKKVLNLGIILVIFSILILSGCSAKESTSTPVSSDDQKKVSVQEEWPGQITIGSFPKGSQAYPSTMAASQLITKYTPTRAIVREITGGAPGFAALRNGVIQIWMVGQPDMKLAYYGIGAYEGEVTEVRLMASYWPLMLGFGVRPGEGINSPADLAGKVVATKTPIPYLNDMIKYTLEYYGVWDKVQHATVDTIGSGLDSLMIDKTIDAYYSAQGGFAQVIKQSVGLDFLSISDEAAEHVINNVPGTTKYEFPDYMKEMFAIPLEREIQYSAVLQAFGIRSDVPDHVVYGMLDAIYTPGHLDEVLELSSDLKNVSIEFAVSEFEIPFHEGAIQYFKDRGVWTDEHDKRQKELLNTPRNKK